YKHSTVTMSLSSIGKMGGVNMNISAACASGYHSVGVAYLLIKSGLQDMIVAGGAQEVNKYAMGSFDALGTFSPDEDIPQQASRPCDQSRNGLIRSGEAAT